MHSKTFKIENVVKSISNKHELHESIMLQNIDLGLLFTLFKDYNYILWSYLGDLSASYSKLKSITLKKSFPQISRVLFNFAQTAHLLLKVSTNT